MRHIVVLLAIALIIGLMGHVLMSPAYLGDYRWVIITLPMLLLVVREMYDLLPGRPKRPRRLKVSGFEFLPVEDDEDEAKVEDINSPSAHGASPLAGLWSGTLKIWPTRPEEVLAVVPLYLEVAESDNTCTLVKRTQPTQAVAVTAARVVAFEPGSGEVDMTLDAEDHHQRRRFDVQLTLQGNTLANEDPGDEVSVELRRAVLAAITV